MIFEIDKDTHLFYRVWEPEGKLLCKVVFVHGYAEHSGRYDYAARYLAAAGMRVYAYDHPGHGNSAGKKGLVSGIRDFAENLNHFVRFVKRDREKAKVFIIGHSMGGAIAAAFGAGYGCCISGIVTSAAAIMPVPMLSRPLRAVASYVSMFIPEAGTVKLPPEKLSRDQRVVEGYKKDPLNYNGRVKLKTAVELSGSLELIGKKARNIYEPILVLHGSDDTLAKPEGSRFLYEKVSSEDRQIKIFDGLRHELFNEPEKDYVLKTVREWIETRV